MIIIIALGLVVTETEQIANKTNTTVKALKNAKLMKSQLTSNAFQQSVNSMLFAFWPFLQVRASWNIIAYPLVCHCLVIPLTIYVFWPKSKKRKVAPGSNNDSASAQSTAEISTRGDEGDDDGCAGDGEVRSASRVPL